MRQHRLFVNRGGLDRLEAPESVPVRGVRHGFTSGLAVSFSAFFADPS